jgi:hypothetical protein
MAAIEFMTCIAGNCGREKCACQENQFYNACGEIRHHCPSVGLTCNYERASCYAPEGNSSGGVLKEVVKGQVTIEHPDEVYESPETLRAPRIPEVETAPRRPCDQPEPEQRSDASWKEAWRDSREKTLKADRERSSDSSDYKDSRSQKWETTPASVPEKSGKPLEAKFKDAEEEPEGPKSTTPAPKKEGNGMQKIFIGLAIAAVLIIVGYALFR